MEALLSDRMLKLKILKRASTNGVLPVGALIANCEIIALSWPWDYCAVRAYRVADANKVLEAGVVYVALWESMSDWISYVTDRRSCNIT